MGYIGIWAAVPYAIGSFLAVEGVPLVQRKPKIHPNPLPRGLIGSMLILAALPSYSVLRCWCRWR